MKAIAQMPLTLDIEHNLTEKSKLDKISMILNKVIWSPLAKNLNLEIT